GVIGRKWDLRRRVGRVRVRAPAAQQRPALVELLTNRGEPRVGRLVQVLRIRPQPLLLLDEGLDPVADPAVGHRYAWTRIIQSCFSSVITTPWSRSAVTASTSSSLSMRVR